MKIKLDKHIATAAKILLSLAIMGFVLYKIDTKALVDVFHSVRPAFLLPALACFVFSKLVSAYRLNKFLYATGIQISNTFNIRLYLLGMFYNLFLPGGIGGDGYKIYLLNKRFGVRVKKIFLAILIDRLMGLLALFCLVSGLSAFIALPLARLDFAWLLIPVAVFSSYILTRQLFSGYTRIFFKALGQSFVVQLSQVTSAIFILFSIGVSGQIPEYVFIFMVSSIVAALPITIGGIGSREVTFLFGSQLMGLDVSISIALSLLFYLITAFVSLWGIYYSIQNNKLK